MIKIKYYFLICSIIYSCLSLHVFAKDLLIKNARLIDGIKTSSKLMDILIQDGIILKIGYDILNNEAEILDINGANILPGLIDAHVHLQWVPGSVYRKDDPEMLHKFRMHHLRAYLASGVTTVLDTGISAPVLENIQKYLKSGGIGPNVFALAPTFIAKNGYLGDQMKLPQWGPHWRAANSEHDIKLLFKQYNGIPNIIGVKVHIEFGFGPFDIWPIHTPEIRKLILKESEKFKLPIYVHSHEKRERKIALEMGAHAMTHNIAMEGIPSDEFIQSMKIKGTYLTTTICNSELKLVYHNPERLQDPLIKLTVPKEQILTASDPDSWELMSQITFRNAVFPKATPNFIPDLLSPLMLDKDQIIKLYNNVRKSIFAMYEAGIPIVVGSDSGNLPHFVNMFHGPSTIKEIELLGKTGIPNIDVISSATRIPAEMMGIDNIVGTIDVGKRADLIVVKEDPLEDLRALRNLLWVIKDGEVRNPKDWILK